MDREDLRKAREGLEQGTDKLLVRIAKRRGSWLIVLGVIAVSIAVGVYAEQLNPMRYLGC